MKKSLILSALLAIFAIFTSCNETKVDYNPATATVLVSKIQNEVTLTPDDYASMIAQADAALAKFSLALDSLNVTNKSQYDEAMKQLATNKEFAQMINDCDQIERALKDATLEGKNKKAYQSFLKNQKKFKEKYLK